MLIPSQSLQYQKESVERALTCANCGQKLHVLEVHVCSDYITSVFIGYIGTLMLMRLVIAVLCVSWLLNIQTRLNPFVKAWDSLMKISVILSAP